MVGDSAPKTVPQYTTSIWGVASNSFTELIENRNKTKQSANPLHGLPQRVTMAPTAKNNSSGQARLKQDQNQPKSQSNSAPANKRQKTQSQPQFETVSNGTASSASRQNSPAIIMSLRKKNPLNFSFVIFRVFSGVLTDAISSKPNAEMVEILVGTHGQLFRIHKAAICYWSPYFNNLFASDTTEGRTKLMKLPDMDENVFGLFNNYIYTQEVEHDEGKGVEIMELAQLWTCAAEWKVPSLQNKVMDILIPLLAQESTEATESNSTLLAEFVKHAYSSKGSSPLKKLAALKAMKFAPPGVSLREWAKEYPEGMLLDLAEGLMAHINRLPKAARTPKIISGDYMVPED